METKRKPPNPNGNPNFRSRWDNLGETATIRLPQSLHEPFKRLASDINDGRVKLSDLSSLEAKVAALTQERDIALNDLKGLYKSLDVMSYQHDLACQENAKLQDRLLVTQLKLDTATKVKGFEELQKQSWGKSANQRGEFTTDSPRWQKFNEFKAWLANQ